MVARIDSILPLWLPLWGMVHPPTRQNARNYKVSSTTILHTRASSTHKALSIFDHAIHHGGGTIIDLIETHLPPGEVLPRSPQHTTS